MDLDVVNMFIIAGGTLAIPILAFVASFLLWPAALIKVYHWYWRRRLRMQVDYAEYEGYHFCYSHRGYPGTRPSVLMLHGFSAHKDMWLGVVKFLPKNVHLVCVDMPGHEGTTRTSAVDYSIEGQVKRIHQFVKSIRMSKKPFHLIGTSMGGNVAGVYAARHLSDLCGVTLICPAGLQYPTESKFVQRLRELEKTQNSDGIPLIPSTPEEMEEMLKLCSYVRFKIPKQVFINKIINVLDVSGASVLAKAIPGSQVHLLDNCGHSVVMERPRKSAQLIMDFIIAQQNVGINSTKKLS
ncbi:monoacylglycerol lipase ABHD6-like [Sinocyclocheilus anshuiensis]|uniref:monoacylglycerol lipase ABHD6-like n=1 Tax=Sinocyclocheilus anshuiensis TaxID=1608454 RepID=UPI0007B99ADB|nr:PREDICTED: monoacylglycerol lipase ABHD6-like [Sinocyclocheilus anshuiensis]